MNIHNFVFTLIFCSATAYMDIAGDFSFDLLIHRNRNSDSISDFTEDNTQEQTYPIEKRYASSNENNHENTQEQQEKVTQEQQEKYVHKKKKNKKNKAKKQKKVHSESEEKKYNILRTVALPKSEVNMTSNMTSTNNQPNEIQSLESEEPAIELNKSAETYKTTEPLSAPTEEPPDMASPHKIKKSNVQVTSAPLVECVYQYPEEEQINTLLSDMTNLLTKLCAQTTKVTSQGDRRWAKKRFRVVPKMDATAFERSFLHMVKEFKESCNKVTERLDVKNDPCKYQKELKTTWKELLKHSEETLQKAALQCARELLQVRNRVDDSSSMQTLGEALVKELSNVRFRHLEVLCDQFQLCFNDLI